MKNIQSIYFNDFVFVFERSTIDITKFNKKNLLCYKDPVSQLTIVWVFYKVCSMEVRLLHLLTQIVYYFQN